MKTVIALFLIASALTFESVSCKTYCNTPPGNVSTEWITMVEPCIQKMRDQVQVQLKAAMTYLAMGAHFSRDVINRPGFAKLFFESASEERDHAINIISYLLKRGELVTNVSSLIKHPRPLSETWDDGLSALNQALTLEANVTKKIKDIIITCEESRDSNNNVVDDYNLVTYLSTKVLKAQYKGERDLAGKISILSMMITTFKSLGEFLFDKKLLNGEPL